MKVKKIANEGVGKYYTDYELNENDELCFVDDWKFSKEEATRLCDYLRSSGQLVTTSYNGKEAIGFTLLDVKFLPMNVPADVMTLLNSLVPDAEKPKSKSKKVKADLAENINNYTPNQTVNEEQN